MKMILHKLKVLAPWIVATAILAYLFHLYPPSKVWKSLTYVNLWPFLLFSAAYFVVMYFFDAWATQRVLARFTHRVALTEMLIARGATYPIMLVSYPASQAAYAYYLRHRHRIPVFEVLSTFIFIMFIDLWWIATLALVGSFFQDHVIAGIDLSHIVFRSVLAMYVFYAVWIAFWHRWPSTRFWRRVTPSFIERQRQRKIFHLFVHARGADYLRVGAMRIPIHITIIVSIYFLIRLFNCEIPFAQILSNIPIVFFVGTLPITPGGIGTTNALMVELLKSDISGTIFSTGMITPAELLFSASLAWMFINYFFKIVTGTAFMNIVSKKLFEPLPSEPEEVVEHDAAHLGGNL